MKTSLLLALIASTALATGALAQSTATGTGTPPTATTSGTDGTSSATGSNTGSGSTTGMGSSSTAPETSGSATPGSQSPNPNIHGTSSGGTPWNQGGWGGQPMMQGMMTCVSPAPMGGFGSFACYPAGWGMGMGMGMDGMDWHHRHHGSWGDGEGGYTPNEYYQERQTWRGKRDRSRVPGWDNDSGSSGGGDGYDNDWRSDGDGEGDYSNE